MKFKFMGKKYKVREGSPLEYALIMLVLAAVCCCPTL